MNRKTPSDINPTTAERLLGKRLAARLFPNGIPKTSSGPHWEALLDFLHFYAETEHEKTVWHEYHRRATPANELDTVKTAAEADGLSLEEFEAREQLKQLRKFCISCGIGLPPNHPKTDTIIPLSTLGGIRDMASVLERLASDDSKELRRMRELTRSYSDQTREFNTTEEAKRELAMIRVDHTKQRNIVQGQTIPRMRELYDAVCRLMPTIGETLEFIPHCTAHDLENERYKIEPLLTELRMIRAQAIHAEQAGEMPL